MVWPLAGRLCHARPQQQCPPPLRPGCSRAAFPGGILRLPLANPGKEDLVFGTFVPIPTMICPQFPQMIRVAIIVVLTEAGFLPSVIKAQQPTPTPRPLLSNGNMERSSTKDNLWDGVDASGKLVVERASVLAVTSSGSANQVNMPPSVVVRDFNGDGTQDLLVADPLGYLRFYPNSGTKVEPKFTYADIHSVFTSNPDYRRAPRISLTSFRNPSGLDLLMGNYYGEILLLPSVNAGTLPSWSQPKDIPSVTIPTYSGNRLWGNLFAPVAHDMNGDGRLDLLIGEGSYSANSIHLLLNQGSNATPVFNETQRYFLITGDGREQLAPALIDANGDRFMDVLVADRLGEITLHIHPGPAWKPGDPFKAPQTLSLGGRTSLGSSATVYPADMNGDGNFDLILGRNNGTIALAINTGTNDKPVFNAPVELKGENLDPQRIKIPSGWRTDSRAEQGNAFSVIQVVTVEDDAMLAPPEGKAAVRMGYLPNRNKRLPDYSVNISPKSNPQAMKTFVMDTNVRLENNASYEVKFFSKGSKASKAEWFVRATGSKTVGEVKIERGERGIVQRKADDRNEKFEAKGTIRTGSSWVPNSSRFKVEFKDRELQKEGTSLSNPQIVFQVELPSYDAELYLDDIQVIKVN